MRGTLMAKYLGKRIFYIILTLFIVSTITFFMMKLMPGTPLTNQAKLTPTQIHQIYKQYGLDKPVWQQYLVYLGGIIHGNFGTFIPVQ
jgi:oligopeptide transport system permease protein